MKKGLKRTLIYSAIVGSFLVGAFVCYGVSRNYRAQYKEYGVSISDAKTSSTMSDEEKEAKVAELTAKQTEVNNVHKVVAGVSYGLTIGALASFGICLAVSDKIKAKEEAIAEGRAK